MTATLLALTAFLLLTAYYFLKTAREPLILLGGGAEVKSYAAGGQALLLLVFVRAYGSVAKRVGRLRLLTTVYLFFVSNLIVFALLARANVPVGVPFYLWVGVFNYTSIAQFWALAADLYSPEQGKRLFAILGIGSSLGAVAGAKIAGAIVPFGPQALMGGAAVLLVVCVGLIGWVDARSRGERVERANEDGPLSDESAFALLVRDRFLLLLAALTLILNWVNSNGEYLLDRTLLAALAAAPHHTNASAFIGHFKADYFAWVNLIGVLLQLFAVSRILSRFGVQRALYLLPAVAFAGYGLLLVAPVLAFVRVAKIAENSLDYSVQNTSRQALYLVANRAEKFVGKTTVDTLFVRLGDVLSAVLVWIAVRLSLPLAVFALINLAFIGVWFVTVTALGREHERRASHLVAAPSNKPVLVAAIVATVLLLASSAGATSEKRTLPDYDGRGGDPTTAGDVAIWVPRVVLAPGYLVTEYVVRRPLGAGIAGAERANWPQTLYNFFFFGPDHKAGFAPIAFLDFGFRPAFGIYTFWDDALFKGQDLSAHASIGGTDWLAGAFSDRFRFSRNDSFTLRVVAIKRPDHTFFGIGPDTVQSNISRYGERRLEGHAIVRMALWRSSIIETSLGVRSIDTYNGHFDGDPSLSERASTGAFPIPDGFGSEYTALSSRVYIALDTRNPRPAPGSGFRLELEGEGDADVRQTPAPEWARYGATAGAFVDLNGHNRVLSLSVGALFVDPIGQQQQVPFTELVSIAARDPWMNDDGMSSGSGPMRGLYPGRLLDRSAAVATLRYRWPIWVWLDGSLQVATGNVFGEHLEKFDPSLFRMSGAVGVETVGGSDGSFEMLVGLGTETFDQGAKVDSVRIAAGINHGF